MEPQNGTDAGLTDTSAELSGENVSDPGPDATAGATPAPQPQGNPAWAPIREVLGDDLFNVNVAPHLQKFDEAANSRITSLNTQLKGYEGYTPFVEQGVSPDDINMAMQLRQLVEGSPEEFYAMLGQHLGLTEEQAEGLEQFGAGQENAAEIPPHILQRLEAAEQYQQQQIQQQQDQQMQAQQAQQIEQEGQRLDQEMSDFLTGNPTYTKDDEHELFRLQYELTKQLEARGLNRMATLDEAAAALTERTNYYRGRGQAPGAPNTLPTTTGGAIPGQKPDTAKMSKDDLNSFVADALSKSQSS